MIYEINLTGFKELEKSLLQSPKMIEGEVGDLIQMSMALLSSGVKNSPWKVGGSGGGSPVAMKNGGNLRAKHVKSVTPWSGKLEATASYAKFVHDGTRFMKARPWLEYTLKDKQPAIESLAVKMLQKIVEKL